MTSKDVQENETMLDKDKENTKSTTEKSKSYAPLSSKQIKTVMGLTTEVLAEKISAQRSNHVRVTDFWTNQQKQEAEQHERNVEEAHQKYSAY